MSILDRQAQRKMENRLRDMNPDSRSETSQALAPADPPITRRLRATLYQILNFIHENGTETDQKRAWILDILVDEITEELSELDQEKMGSYWNNIGSMFQWIGTGDMSLLPPELVPFACRIEGIPFRSETDGMTPLFPDPPEAEMLAIEQE